MTNHCRVSHVLFQITFLSIKNRGGEVSNIDLGTYPSTARIHPSPPPYREPATVQKRTPLPKKIPSFLQKESYRSHAFPPSIYPSKTQPAILAMHPTRPLDRYRSITINKTMAILPRYPALSNHRLLPPLPPGPLQPTELPHIPHFHILDLINRYPRLNLVQQPLRPLRLLSNAPLLLLRFVDLQVESLEIDRKAAVEPFEALRVPLSLYVTYPLAID